MSAMVNYLCVDATVDDIIYQLSLYATFACRCWTAPDSKVHGQIWSPSGADKTQVGTMLAPWTLLSGAVFNDKFS